MVPHEHHTQPQHTQPQHTQPQPRSAPRRRARTVVGGLVLTGALVAPALPASALPSVIGTATTASTGFKRFSSCTALRNYVLPLALERVGPYGFDSGPVFLASEGGPVRTTKRAASAAAPASAAPATAAPAAEAAPATPVSDAAATGSGVGGNTSSTNTQEAGVDEGDIVETDGRVVYSVIDGAVRVVDIAAGTLLTTIPLPPNAGDAQLLLDGRRLAVVAPEYTAVGPETTVSVYDVSNPVAPRKLVTQHLEGAAVAVRSVDHRARLVLTTSFGQRLQRRMTQDRVLRTDADIRRAIEENRRIVRNAPITEWLPRTYGENADGSSTAIRPALTCGEVGRPRQMSGLGTTWVATIDLDTGNASPQVQGSAGVVAEAGIVYASSDTLYVATTQWQGNIWVNARSVVRPRTPGALTTEITAFDMRPADGARWLATGTVTGRLLNQFSMSEYAGALRVATTRGDAGFGGTTESGVQALQLSSKDRRVLTVVGQVWGLGRGEQVYAVRFVGDLGYVVTFRQVDPLYVIDLRDIRAPRVAGELKIPGYSAYLHPIGDGLILGIGQNATDTGQRLGTQVSLFDVRDPANPQRLANLQVGGQSEAEYDHHAFLWWAATRNVVVPTVDVQCCDAQGRPTGPGAGAVVARVSGREAPAVTLQGRITHDRATPATPATTVSGATPAIVAPFLVSPIRRSLIVNGRLVTVSSKGVKASDLTTLADQVFVAFPGR